MKAVILSFRFSAALTFCFLASRGTFRQGMQGRVVKAICYVGNFYWVGQKVCSGFSVASYENADELFGQPYSLEIQTFRKEAGLTILKIDFLSNSKKSVSIRITVG